jgi:hypothetical protein
MSTYLYLSDLLSIPDYVLVFISSPLQNLFPSCCSNSKPPKPYIDIRPYNEGKEEGGTERTSEKAYFRFEFFVEDFWLPVKSLSPVWIQYCQGGCSKECQVPNLLKCPSSQT